MRPCSELTLRGSLQASSRDNVATACTIWPSCRVLASSPSKFMITIDITTTTRHIQAMSWMINMAIVRDRLYVASMHWSLMCVFVMQVYGCTYMLAGWLRMRRRRHAGRDAWLWGRSATCRLAGRVARGDGSGIVHCVCMCGIVDAFRQATTS